MWDSESTNAANTRVNSSGRILKATSLLTNKPGWTDLDLTTALNGVMGMRPISWIGGDVEDDDPPQVHFGFGAEHLDDINSALADYGPEGPVGIDLPAIVASLVKVVQDQQRRLDEAGL